MSKDKVKKFFGKMEKDADLLKKYSELMQTHQKEAEKALADKLIDLGKTSGYLFSKEDLLSARAEMLDKVNSNKELSDGDLVRVAGGGVLKTGTVCVSIITLGIGCAALSIIAANQPEGCASQLTTSDSKCKEK